MGFKGNGAPGQTRTGDPLLRSYAVQNSKCRFWCRLRGSASFISPLNWTEVGLKWFQLFSINSRKCTRPTESPATNAVRTSERATVSGSVTGNKQGRELTHERTGQSRRWLGNS